MRDFGWRQIIYVVKVRSVHDETEIPSLVQAISRLKRADVREVVRYEAKNRV